MDDFGRFVAPMAAKCARLLKAATALVSGRHLVEGYISAYKASFDYF